MFWKPFDIIKVKKESKTKDNQLYADGFNWLDQIFTKWNKKWSMNALIFNKGNE